MRVKLSYTVELEEVPKKLKEILEEAVHDLASSSSDLMDAKLDLAPMEFLSRVDSVRSKLALVDSRLADCYLAYAGYHRMMLEEHMPVEEQHHDPQGGMHVPDGVHAPDPAEMAELQEHMRALRESTEQLQANMQVEGEVDEQS